MILDIKITTAAAAHDPIATTVRAVINNGERLEGFVRDVPWGGHTLPDHRGIAIAVARCITTFLEKDTVKKGLPV